MKRLTPFTLAIAAAFGIALTPAPAAADGEDIAKIIAGLAVAGIVAKAIDDRNDRKRANRIDPFYEVEPSRRQTFDNFDLRGRDDRRTRWDDDRRRWDQTRRYNRGYKRFALPDRCLRTVGNRNVYASRCLNRNFKFANKLPRDCAFRVRTDRGARTVYGRRCLARDGWQVAGRR